MMEMTMKQLEHEFRRQVYLCRGLGKTLMQGILREAMETDPEWYRCPQCMCQASFYLGHTCAGAASERVP